MSSKRRNNENIINKRIKLTKKAKKAFKDIFALFSNNEKMRNFNILNY